MKKFFFLMTILLVSLTTYASVRYEKVKNDGAINDWSGSYLIVREVSDSVAYLFNGGLDEENLDAKTGNTMFDIRIDTLADGQKYIAESDSVNNAVFTIAFSEKEGMTDYYGVLSNSGYYIGHKDTADNGLSVELTLKTKCHNTISFESETTSKVIIKAFSESGENNFALRFNDEQNRFRYYEWSSKNSEYKKQAIWLYRMVEVADPEPEPEPEALTNRTLRAGVAIRLVNDMLLIERDGVRYDVNGIRR